MINTTPNIWIHNSTGNRYTFLFMTNTETKDLSKFPITAVYKDSKGNIWSRPVKDFLDKFHYKSS